MSFVDQFRAIHGRAPRVLHIGNIANNAYLNAKLLNRHGFDCDVMCHDYYHIMGCPEWEECDFDGQIADHFRPDWGALNLKGYARPRWFAQGPRLLCIDYLVAKRSGHDRRAERLWRDLGFANRTARGDATGRLKLWFQATSARLRDIAVRASSPDAYDLAWWKLQHWASSRGNGGQLLAAFSAPFVILALFAIRLVRGTSDDGATQAANEWAVNFTRAFPDRRDQLSPTECMPYLRSIEPWQRLFAHYDIVQAYATDVAYPMFAGKRPYLGFEHGTLRVFTLADNALSRVTALAYHTADHVFITNGDCLPYAKQIKVRDYTPVPHPFDDAFMGSVEADPAALRARLGAKQVFLCPLRHDWEIKGTDKYIRALPGIVAAIGRDFRVVMTQWGGQVDASRQLAEVLGVEDLIVWHEPFNRVQLVRHLKSADIVFDQIALPCFGGTAPQAIAVGVPVIMSYDSASTEWLIPEPAPILPAWSPEDIVTAVRTALDPNWRSAYVVEARRWYDTHHSARRVVQKHADAYMSVCQAAGLMPASTIE